MESSKVADMHNARAGKMSDVIGKAKVLVKNYTEVAIRRQESLERMYGSKQSK